MTAVVWYAVMFLIASAMIAIISSMPTAAVTTYTFLEISLGPQANPVFGIVIVISSAILAYLLSRYYYFKGKVKDPAKEGLMLGIVVVVISFIIEIPVMVYGFAAAIGWNYFLSWNIIVGYLLALLIPVFAAYQSR